MARKRKISYKIPPLRQLNNAAAMQLGGAPWDQQGINNWSQQNINQNQAAAFNQQFRVGSYSSTYGSGGRFDQGAMNAAGINQNWGANNANTRQDKITGATIENRPFGSGDFKPTSLPTGETQQVSGSDILSLGSLNEGLRDNVVNKDGTIAPTNDIQNEALNTFSSEIDPVDKTQFKNETINNVMASDTKVSQNPFEQLYKLS